MEQKLETKKIAKNTVLLYFRMILGMIVSLYTSRVVLRVLGVDDFGIYNVIGGVIVMFSFINTFLTSACQRFLSFSIAKASVSDTGKVFSTSLFIHFLVLVLFAVVAETVGLWFVSNKLVIPADRITAAMWVFHIMVIESCLSIFKVPYNAAIIAEEKMDFYAYTSIIENVLRLLVVYLLVVVAMDKLVLYALFHIGVTAIMLIWFKIYAEKKFEYCKFSLNYDKGYFKQMISFSGWNLFGSIADIGYKQGTNIILNLFYGVALNAAMGIATTVRASVYSFISNIQVAANPQIIKSYALGNDTYYSNLLYRISKYSYYLMLFLAVPTIVNISYILKLWLGEAPDYTSSLIILGLVFCLIDCLHGPLWTSMQATGNIRNYQFVISTVLLLNLPLSYLCLYLGASPNSILIVQIIVSILTLIIRVVFSKMYAKLSLSAYFREVIIPITLVTVVSAPLPLYLGSIIPDELAKLFITGFASIVTIIASVILLGMTKYERTRVIKIITNRIKK